MKLNEENYELLMFDLLEGNLNKKDELSVMHQIEENEFFFKEWKLFKSTVLVSDEDIVFTNKQSLLKEEATATVIPKRRIWLSAAASICLIALVYIFWPNKSPQEELVILPIETSDPIDDIDTTSIDDVRIERVAELENESYRRNRTASSPVYTFEKQKTQQSIYVNDTSLESEDVPNLKEDNLNENQKVIPELVAVEEDAPKKLGNDTTGVQDQLIGDLEPKQTEMIASNEDPQPAEKLNLTEISKDFVTNNKPSRIKEKANEVIRLVSNPQVRFRPDFKSKRPSLEIELETEGYLAIASLQPFKNRNN